MPELEQRSLVCVSLPTAPRAFGYDQLESGDLIVHDRHFKAG